MCWSWQGTIEKTLFLDLYGSNPYQTRTWTWLLSRFFWTGLSNDLKKVRGKGHFAKNILKKKKENYCDKIFL
jgi:hypothetical protein